MNNLAAALQRNLESALRNRPLMVWYDQGGTLDGLVPGAIPNDARLLQFEGSYLAIRAELEEIDSKLEERWVIYVSEASPKPSWLRDYELAGTLRELSLADLLVKEFGLKVNKRLRRLLSTDVAKTLVLRWNELIGDAKEVSGDQVIRGLLAAAFGAPPGFGLEDLVLSYVGRKEAPERLRAYDLHPEFHEILEKDLGLMGLPEDEVPQERVAAALLLSEAVTRGGLAAEVFGNALPAKEKRNLWVSWADHWREQKENKAFRNWADRIERTYRIPEKLSGLRIADLMSFRSVDQVLIEEVEAILRHGLNPSIMHSVREIARKRRETIWAEEAAKLKKHLPWKVMFSAIELIERTDQACKSLTARTNWSPSDIFNSYASDDGWWRLDDAYRQMEAGWTSLGEGLGQLLGDPTARAYGEFLEQLAGRLGDALARGSRWGVEGWIPQREVWAREVAGRERQTAIILVDSLRFDLTWNLAQDLRVQGVQVEEKPTLAMIPSVTEVGMAALLPQGGGWSLTVDKGTLVLRRNGRILRGCKDRLAVLRQLVRGIEIVELETIHRSAKKPKGGPLVVLSLEIDEQGDFLPQIGLDHFMELVKVLATVIHRLFDAGWSRVVVAADHGFLLIPRGVTPSELPGLGADPFTVKKRRFAVGKPPELSTTLRFPLHIIGWEGEENIAFPRGLAVFSLQGEIPRFLHGGFLPQEVALLTLICQRPVSIGRPIGVRLVEPSFIDTMIPRFTLEATPTEDLFIEGRDVRVIVYLEGQEVGVSESVHIEGPGVRVLVGLRLQRYGAVVDVVVEDTRTREQLDRKRLRVTLPGGYEDLPL